MKKFLMLLIVFLSELLFVACSINNEKQDEYVKISFYVKNEIYKEDTIKKGDKALSIDAPKYNNYNFCGWYLDNEIKFDFNNSLDKDIKVYAKYEFDETYLFTIIGNDNVIDGCPEKYEIKYGVEKIDEEIIWSVEVSNYNITATISNDGLLTTKGVGDLFIIASLKDDPQVCARKHINSIDKDIFVPLKDFYFSKEEFYVSVDSSIQIDVHFVGEPDESGTARRPSYMDLKWRSSDEQIATVNNEGVVTGISEGFVTIFASSNGHVVDGINIEKSIQVYVYIPKAPTKWELKANENFDLYNIGVPVGNKIHFYVETGNFDEDTEAIFSSSNPEIGDIDENGVLNVLGDGTITITATSVRNPSLLSSVEVKCRPRSHVYPPMNLSGYNKMYVGYSQKLVFDIQGYYELLYNRDILSAPLIWKSTNENVAKVDEDGVVKAVGSGKAYIKVSSSLDPNYNATLGIIVEDDYQNDIYPNMGGYEIAIMHYASRVSQIDPFNKSYKSPDKVYKQFAWNEVETNFNCNIVVKSYPEEANYGENRINWISDNAMKNSSQCDLAIIPSSWIPQLVKKSALIDLSNYNAEDTRYVDSDFIIDACSFHNNLYGLSSEIECITNYVDNGLFYNYGMIKEYGIDDPAVLFNEGRWNYTNFEKWVRDASALIGDKKVLSGHPYTFYFGMTNAAGLNIINLKYHVLSATSIASKNAMELLSRLTQEGFVNTYITWGEGRDGDENSFFCGGSLMISSHTFVFQNHTPYSSGLPWQGLDEVGYVPYPHPDNVLKEYTHVGISSLSDIYSFVKGRNYPRNVDSKMVFDAIKMMIRKTNEYMNEDESFDPKTIMRDSIAKYIDNQASIEAMMFFDSNHITFDPAHGIYNSIGGTCLRQPSIEVMFEGKDFGEVFSASNADFEEDFLEVYG